jgi:membrane protein implicated in regulation of membrane protease activity
MSSLQAISAGIPLVLALWALWYLLDPPFRPDGVSWLRLILWIFSPLGLYLFLAHHKEPPSALASPVGKEGTVARLDPLQVEVFGSFWQARSKARGDLRVGERVRVTERDGLTLIVDRLS